MVTRERDPKRWDTFGNFLVSTSQARTPLAFAALVLLTIISIVLDDGRVHRADRIIMGGEELKSRRS